MHERFPSDHLLVDGWDHGYAWQHFSKDYTSKDTILLPALRKAIVEAGVPIDILAFDSCNMADVDVAYQLASTGLVRDYVASEETIDENGYPYDNMFAPLAGDPRQGAGGCGAGHALRLAAILRLSAQLQLGHAFRRRHGGRRGDEAGPRGLGDASARRPTQVRGSLPDRHARQPLRLGLVAA